MNTGRIEQLIDKKHSLERFKRILQGKNSPIIGADSRPYGDSFMLIESASRSIAGSIIKIVNSEIENISKDIKMEANN